MFALAAAIVFALALVLDWADAHVGDAFTWQTLMTLGWLLLAVHFWLTSWPAGPPAWYQRERGSRPVA